jgi:hypothetical protein
VFVTWRQAVDFCAWLSKKEGKTYRLPTEAEWSMPAAPARPPFNTGETLTAEQANFVPTPDSKPVAIGSFKPNAWGLYDTHGNVAEWCHDWHGPYDAGEQTDPVGRGGQLRPHHARLELSAAGQPQRTPRYCRSANRSGLLPEDANRWTGFRVVLGELPATKPASRGAVRVSEGRPPDDPRTPRAPIRRSRTSSTTTRRASCRKCRQTPGGPSSKPQSLSRPSASVPMGTSSRRGTTVNERGARMAGRHWLRASDAGAASLFFDVPDINDHARPVPRRQSDLPLCTQSIRNWDHATDIVRYSDDSGATWSKPTIMVSRDGPKARVSRARPSRRRTACWCWRATAICTATSGCW